jgi:putative transposase
VGLTRGFRIEYRDDLGELFKIKMLKNLHNRALYILNQKHIPYDRLNRVMKRTLNLKEKTNYRVSSVQTSRQILESLDKNYKSFFKSIKYYKINPVKYKSVLRVPKYKNEHKHKIDVSISTNQNSKIEDAIIEYNKGWKDDVKMIKSDKR